MYDDDMSKILTIISLRMKQTFISLQKNIRSQRGPEEEEEEEELATLWDAPDRWYQPTR